MSERNKPPIPRSARREQERARQRELARKQRQRSTSMGRRRLLIASGAAAGLATLGGAAYFFVRSHDDHLPTQLSDEFIKDKLQRYNRDILAQPTSSYWPGYYSSRLGFAFFCQEMNILLGTSEYQREFFDDKLQLLYSSEFKQKADEVNNCNIDPDLTFTKAFVHPMSANIYQNLTAAIWSNPNRPSVIDPFPSYNQFNTSIHEAHHSKAPSVPARPHIDIASYRFDRPLQVEFVRGLTLTAYSPGESKPGQKCYRPIRYEIDEAVVEHNKIHLTRRLNIPGSNITDQYVRWITGYERSILPLFGKDHRLIIRAQQSSDEKGFFEEVGNKIGAIGNNAYIAGIGYVARAVMAGT